MPDRRAARRRQREGGSNALDPLLTHCASVADAQAFLQRQAVVAGLTLGLALRLVHNPLHFGSAPIVQP